jgi:hypothetical protein
MNKPFEVAKENTQTEHKRMKAIEFKLINSHEISNVAYTSITKLQGKPGFERKGNDKLKKRFNETIRNLRYKDDFILAIRSKQKEKRNSEEVIIEIKKSNRDSSEIKINPKVDNTDLDLIGQEIIFKVQIISSGTLLQTNSPKLKDLKNVWKYKDGGLYKYTVGNEKDLKSASELQTEIRKKGFSGAFVVAFKNGKRITVRDARKFLASN